MMNFHCELAAILSNELIIVSGWAGGAEALRLRVGEDQDITECVIRYYRGDVSESMRESGMPLDAPPAAAGVMALAPLRLPLAPGGSCLLHVENGSGSAQSFPLELVEASDLKAVLEHLYFRFPYFLACYTKDAPALQSALAGALFDQYLQKYPRGIEQGREHRFIDASGNLGVSVEVSCVLRRRSGLLLVVSGHIGTSSSARPVIDWITSPGFGPEWFSFEAPETDGVAKLTEHGLHEIRRFVGVLPLSRLAPVPRVATLQVTSGSLSGQVSVPVTAPISLAEFVAKFGSIGVTAVAERLAAGRREGPAPEDLGWNLEASALCIQPSTLGTTATDMSAGARVNAAIDHAFVLTNDCVVALGWALSASGNTLHLTCHDTSGRVFGRKALNCWIQRRDVADVCRQSGIPLSNEHVGFCAVFDGLDLDGIRRVSDSLYFSVEDEHAVCSRFRPWKVEVNSGDWAGMLGKILTQLKNHDPERWLSELAPLLSRVWSSRPKHSQSIDAHVFGAVPARPAVSVIVPLYGRVDLMEYQLACFARDNDMNSAELIYFLDDPRQTEHALEIAGRCHKIFGVPFRLLLSDENLGYAGANNKAAEHAKGEVLLLLNSDVMPKTAGWLRRMLDTFRALPDVGALGARLLFEDDSIQHAGMTFEARIGRRQTLWLNEHPFKGYPSRLVPKRGTERVPAVTAACMMVNRAVFESNGGLSEDYIYADFEDSDFCLRLLNAGLRCYVAHDVELYHLERQSVPALGEASWREALVLVNAWIHTNRWGSVIAHLNEQTS